MRYSAVELGKPVSHSLRINAGSESVTIFCTGDFHEDDPRRDSPQFAALKDEFKSSPNPRLLLLGDYGEQWRPSSRERLSSILVRDDDERSQFDDDVRRKQDPLIKRLSFAEGKIIGIHSGHHHWTFASGENTDQRLASALRAPYLDIVAISRVQMIPCGDSRHALSYTLMSMHGAGSSKFVCSDGAQWQNAIFPYWIADHYVRGHGHKAGVWCPGARNVARRFGPAGIIEESPTMMMVGGLRRCYTDGHTSYEEQKLLPPQPISWGIIRLKINRRTCTSAARGLARQAVTDGHGARMIVSESVTRIWRP